MRCLAGLFAFFAFAVAEFQAATVITDFRLDGPDARFSLRSDPHSYYLVEWTTDLAAFNDLVMPLGDPAPNPAYRVLPMFPSLFFRGTPLDLFAPSDRDGPPHEWQHRTLVGHHRATVPARRGHRPA